MKLLVFLALFFVSIVESFKVESHMKNDLSEVFSPIKSKRAIPVSASMIANLARFQGTLLKLVLI